MPRSYNSLVQPILIKKLIKFDAKENLCFGYIAFSLNYLSGDLSFWGIVIDICDWIYVAAFFKDNRNLLKAFVHRNAPYYYNSYKIH